MRRGQRLTATAREALASMVPRTGEYAVIAGATPPPSSLLSSAEPSPVQATQRIYPWRFFWSTVVEESYEETLLGTFNNQANDDLVGPGPVPLGYKALIESIEPYAEDIYGRVAPAGRLRFGGQAYWRVYVDQRQVYELSSIWASNPTEAPMLELAPGERLAITFKVEYAGIGGFTATDVRSGLGPWGIFGFAGVGVRGRWVPLDMAR